MIGTARPRKYTYILPLCLFTLLLAIAWPAPAAAQPADLPPGEPGTHTWWCTPDPSPGPPTGPPDLHRHPHPHPHTHIHTPDHARRPPPARPDRRQR